MKTNAKFADVILVRGDKNYQMLMLQRNDDNDFMPGKWGLPGGHVDEGESIYDAALRECEEETSIMPKHLSKLLNYQYKDGANTTIFIGFSGLTFEQDTIRLTIREHKNHDWRTPLEWLNEKDLMPELKEILKEAFKLN